MTRPEVSAAYCERCDKDMHICPGCGKPLSHGIDVCVRCRHDR